MATPPPSTSPTSASPESPLDYLGLHSDWLSQKWPDILFGLVAGILIYVVLEGIRLLALTLVKRLCVGPRVTFFTILHRVVRKTSHLFLVLAAARLTVSYMEPPQHVFQTVNFLFTVAAVLQAARWLRAGIFGFIDSRADLENGGNEALVNASGLIRTLVNGVLVVVALIVILDNLNVNVTGLIAGLGIGGIAIGLAAQGIFSDLFASLSIIFDRPFRVGETIDFGKGPAVVERIGLKSTRMRALTGEKLVVSNAQLLSKEIVSFTGLHKRRFTFPMGFVYQTAATEAARVPDIVREVVEANGVHFVRAGFTAFGPQALEFEVQFDIEEGEMSAINAKRHEVGIALLERFNALGFKFAYAAPAPTPPVPNTR
ncbi:MAG TPA: mechanosensitive ion channel domain-containing protein [Sphingobium sp.]